MKHVEKDFWPDFNTASGVFNIGEVSSGNIPYLCDYQNYMDGLLNYGAYYQIIQFFADTSATTDGLVNGINLLNTDCLDVGLLGSFTENHDVTRFANLTPDMTVCSPLLLIFAMLI